MTSVRKLARLTTVFLLIAGAQRLASGSPLEEDWQSFELAQASSASSSSGLPFARIETGATIRGGHTEFWGEFLAYLAESLQSELQRKRLAEALSRVRSVVEADRQGSYWMLIDLFELQSESVTHRRTVAIYLLKGKTLQEAMVSFYREPSLKPEPPENFRYAPLVQRIVASGPDDIATFPIPTQLVKKTIREAKARIDIESRLGEVNQAIGEISDELGKITGKSADQLTVADIKGLQTLKEHAVL
jgi:hypothetical protein